MPALEAAGSDNLIPSASSCSSAAPGWWTAAAAVATPQQSARGGRQWQQSASTRQRGRAAVACSLGGAGERRASTAMAPAPLCVVGCTCVHPCPILGPPLITRRRSRAGAPLFASPAACRTVERRRGWAQICRDSSLQGPPGADSPAQDQEDQKKSEPVAAAAARIASGGGGGGGKLSDWTTSALIFGIWAGFMYYIFQLAPNQTPYRDTYFLQKLLNLKGDDGFRMNDVLVALWYIMGIWPLVYSMLLLPTGRSSKSKIPVWPFLLLSCIGGAYALIPYFVLWKPPPPPIDEDEIEQWPLKFLESKLTAGVVFALGIGLIIYAGKAGGDDWKEFIRYFRESKFIHATCLDFSLLSAFSPFWVYNDMTARRWKNGSWLLPLALIPFVGPSLYLLLRPSLSSLLAASASSSDEIEK